MQISEEIQISLTKAHMYTMKNTVWRDPIMFDTCVHIIVLTDDRQFSKENQKIDLLLRQFAQINDHTVIFTQSLTALKVLARMKGFCPGVWGMLMH